MIQNIDFIDGFSWPIPTAFTRALAICRFERGDTLYSHLQAYKLPWEQAKPFIKYSIQVHSPAGKPPVLKKEEKESKEKKKSIFQTNSESIVIFTLTDYSCGQKKEIVSTQGQLYKFLQSGNINYLFQKVIYNRSSTAARKQWKGKLNGKLLKKSR